MADMKDTAKQIIDSAAERAKQGVDKTADFAAQARGKVSGWAANPAEAARAAKGQFREFVAEARETAPASVRDFGTDLAAMIRKNPIPAAMIGLCIGLLLGRGSKS